MDDPAVSVVLPVHNGEAVVDGAIDSIVAQTESNWELLVLDDASSDRSWDRLTARAAVDPRIRCRRFDRQRGLGAAMNALVREVRAPIIAIHEQDDRSDPDRLRVQAEAFRSCPEAGLCFGRARWLEADRSRARLAPDVLADDRCYAPTRDAAVEMLFVGRNQVQNPTVAYRAEALRGLAFDEEARLAVDLAMHLRVAHQHRIIGVPAVLATMNRGALGPSATSDRGLAERQRRRCLRLAHRRHRRDQDSPISTRLYRRALAAQFVVEGRRRGGLAGAGRFVAALAVDPGHRGALRSLRQVVANRLSRERVQADPASSHRLTP